MTKVTKTTRTEDGCKQFCRGALEHGEPGHFAKTYTTLYYGDRRFHFCDEHPPESESAPPVGEGL